MSAILIDDPTRVVLGSEPVLVDGRVSGRVTSGGFGYSTGASIAYAYLAISDTDPGTAVTIDLFGDLVPGTVVAEPVLKKGAM